MEISNVDAALHWYTVLTTEGYYDAANDRDEPISHCVPKFVAFGTSPFSIYASSS